MYGQQNIKTSLRFFQIYSHHCANVRVLNSQNLGL